MTKMFYTNKGIDFKTNSMKEELTKNECLFCSNNHELRFSFTVTNRNGEEKTHYRTTNPLSWHHQVKYANKELVDNPAVSALNEWGLNIAGDSIGHVQNVLNAKLKKFHWNSKSLEDVKASERYKRAFGLVESQYGGILSDGKQLAPYQKEGAALMIANQRLFLCFDMGLGSAKRSSITA